ncbi:MAG TPA: hypothetical protein VF702_09140 [Allosphingosinicella sp.]
MSDVPEPDETPPAEPRAEAELAEDYLDEDGYTTSEFHNVVQKQIVNATYETLVESKLHWDLIEPFLRAARDVCRGDFRRTGRVEVHGVVAEGEGWADAEEAYLSVAIADQDDGREWLSQTWWLSDLVLAGGEPAQVREAARALERTVARLDAWLAEQGASGGDGVATKQEGPDEGGS